MLTFRDATADQAGLISHIYATSWRKTYRGHIAQHYLDRLPDEYWVPSIRSWLSSGQLYGLMVYDDDKPVGCCIYGRGRDEITATGARLCRSICCRTRCVKASAASCWRKSSG